MNSNIKPLPLALNDANYLSKMRAVLTSRPLFLTDHAKVRMKERKVSSKQIHDCVAKGAIEEPAHINVRGHWSATVGYFTGGDHVKVVTAITQDDKGEFIVVITVII